jgi:hypothetical protein
MPLRRGLMPLRHGLMPLRHGLMPLPRSGLLAGVADPPRSG